MININGHTASVPNPDTYRVSDWTLSSERASNIAIYFEEEKGIDPHKLRPIGYGRNYPIASNDTPEGREKNRRVDMVIISEEADIAKDGKLSQELAGLFDPSLFPKSGSTADILIPGEDETEEVASSPAQSEAQTQTDTAENTTADMAEPTAPEEQQ